MGRCEKGHLVGARGALARAFCCAFAAAIACLSLVGCFGIPKDPQVAATVNGTEILENDVTDYIEGFRSKNDSYSTDEGWASFLASAGYTPVSFRTHVLDTTFIPNELVRQECASRKIAVTDDQLDLVIEREKEYYEQRYGADSWDSVLASFGYDEATWRDNEELRLLEEQLTDVVVEDKKASRSDILREARSNGSNYNGQHSRYLSFASEEKAAEAFEKLDGKASGSATRKAFKKLGKPEDAGWNSLPADRDGMSNEYLNALNATAVGNVSEPFQDGDSWRIVLCDKVFACPQEITYARLASFPKAIYEQIESDASKAHVERAYMAWLDSVTDESDIQVMPMPDGLPYAAAVDEKTVERG